MLKMTPEISNVPFKRRIRIVNGSFYISLPKDLLYAAKLKLGDYAEFTMSPIKEDPIEE